MSAEVPLPARIENEIGYATITEDEIIDVVGKPGKRVDRALAEDTVARLAQLTGGRSRPGLVDMRQVSGVSLEARRILTGAGAAAVFRAVAILVDSPLSRVIGNFFIGLNRPPYPARLFSKREAAISWLRSFRA